MGLSRLAGWRGMTTLALAAAQLLAEDVDAWGMPILRALLPLAGMTLIEQQAERARGAGVSKFLVLVDGVPPALAEACDRMRSRGLDVELVRSGADVLRLSKGHSRLMLVADGLVAGEQSWAAADGARAPAMLVTEDASVTQGLERIDAESRWAGLATLPISALAALETAPRDWDPQLLLFRAAVQEGAGRIAIDPALFVRGDMMVAETAEAVMALERRLLTQEPAQAAGLGRRYLASPLIRVFGGALLGSQRSGIIARVVAPVTFLCAGAAFLIGLPWVAAGLGVAGVMADEVANFVARFRAESPTWKKVGLLALPAQLLALFIGERGASLDRGLSLGEGAFPLVVLVAIAVLGKRIRLLADDAMVWPSLMLCSFFAGWAAAFDWVMMAVLLVLALQLIEPTMPPLPWRGKDATKKT